MTSASSVPGVPRVSVVIPSWSAEAFIAETVASVLAQSLSDWELVIVDDSSPDATVAVARAAAGDDPRVRIEANPDNLGPAGNWNRAVSMARAPYVKLLCSDDVLLPDCLARQAAVLDAHPEAGLVAARRDVIDARGRVRFASRGLQGLSAVMDGPSAIRAMVACATTPFGEPSVVLFRRAALQSIDASGNGPFDERFGSLIDVDAYARILRNWGCVAIDATLARFRMSSGSWSDRSHAVQGANARRLFRELAADPSLGISRGLLARCIARTYVNQWGRRAAFALESLRGE
jgi:glycosyltransferase involved in cell wall biosynthesis